jgi:hypothetical protein
MTVLSYINPRRQGGALDALSHKYAAVLTAESSTRARPCAIPFTE